MTIAAGFVCREGVLLCADTEHTAWATKTHASKVGHFEHPRGKIAFAYAGHTRFAFSAIQMVKRRLQTVRTKGTLAEVEEVLDREYRRNVLKHPDHATDGSLHYQFLLAIWSSGEGTRLYATTQTAIQEIDGYECIGIGDYLAHYLIRPTFGGGMPQRSALSVAAYALTGVKDNVPGCGGMSIYQLLQNDGKIGLVTSLHDGPCQQLQQYSKAYDFATRQLLMALVNEQAEDADFERYMTETFNQGLLQVRRGWTQERHQREATFAALNPHLTASEARDMLRQLALGILPDTSP